MTIIGTNLGFRGEVARLALRSWWKFGEVTFHGVRSLVDHDSPWSANRLAAATLLHRRSEAEMWTMAETEDDD